MFPLNKLALQLELIDENTWKTLPGANQDYVIVSNPLMQIQVVRDTEHTYDVGLTPDPLIDRLWTRPKKTKLLIKVTARTLVGLSDSILKRLVKPHQQALVQARKVYEEQEIAARMANEGLRPFVQRHHIDEGEVIWAGAGNRVAGFYLEEPDTSIHVISMDNDVREGAVRVSHLSLEELDEVIHFLKSLGEQRWKKRQTDMTPLVPEELSSPATESPVETEQSLEESVLADDSLFSTSSETS